MSDFEVLTDLPEWIHVRDKELHVVWATTVARDTFGWSVQDTATGAAPSDIESLKEAARQVQAQGHWAGRMGRKDANGNHRELRSRWSPLRDESGTLSGYFILERNAEELLVEDKHLLRAQRMESISTLAGGVAHDINNVLGPILIGAEMIRRKVDDPWVQKKLEGIEASARRGAEIMKQVLDFSRGVEGEKIVVQIRHVLKELVDFGGHTFSKSITIEGDLPRDLATIVGDAVQIRQCVLNLMVNARDAMPDGGTLSLAAAAVTLDAAHAARISPQGIEGSYVRIDVEDTGSGIPPNVVDRIFEPFFTTKTRGQGTGLGLSTSLSIVQGHGGFLSVSSTPGEGSTFSLFFPTAGKSSADAPPLVFTTLSASSGSRTILIVDDEPMMLEMNADMLQSYGFETLTAEHGQAALDLFMKNPAAVDIVVTDINMPVMDGPTMIREMRAVRPDLPIVAVSGLSEVDHAREGTGLEGIQILNKPYTSDDLLGLVSRRLGLENNAPPVQPSTSNESSEQQPMTDSAFDNLMGGDDW